MSDPTANQATIAMEVSRLERLFNGGLPASTARDWVVTLVRDQPRNAFTAADLTAAVDACPRYVRDPARPLRDQGRPQYHDVIELATAARDRRRADAARVPEARQITASARRETDADAVREAEARRRRTLATEAVACMWMLPDELDWRRRADEPVDVWQMRHQREDRRAAEIWEALIGMEVAELVQVRDRLLARVQAHQGHTGLLSTVGRVGEMR
jgi:hypothetical protein